MRIEIVQELESDDDTLEVPWTSPADQSLRYWDLKLNLQKIAELPECGKFPALGACLAKINSPGLELRTAKCGVWVASNLADDERMDFNLPVKVGSYVEVVFDREEFRGRPDTHSRFAEKIRSGLRDLRVQGQMEIIPPRCLFHPEDIW